MPGTEERRPEVVVIAGPNGSGKSTFTWLAKPVGAYINADDIKRCGCSTDLEAAQMAERLRERMLAERRDFTFETVLSTERNLLLLRRAREQGYFVRGFYLLTSDAEINVLRVRSRAANGGHGVPEDKIRTRYSRALHLVPELVDVCDVLQILDNTDMPFRIFRKRKNDCDLWENAFWNERAIRGLTGISYSPSVPATGR